MTFKLTARQQLAQQLLASKAKHVAVYGGSRSGKTFLLIRAIVLRALKAPGSRHAVFRFRFNAIKSSIVFDTFPKVMQLCFPGIKHDLSKTDWYVRFENGSEIWFGGLDDKERAEKVLGMEFVTIYLNEASQIPLGSRNMALTRLAQKVHQVIDGAQGELLTPREWVDCNPPSKAHWTYKLFVQKQDPETKLSVSDPSDYASFQINPRDNESNLSPDYIATLEGMSGRLQRRFMLGEFADANPNALFSEEVIDTWRVTDGVTPDYLRIVVAVDPSGSGDDEQADAIGICVAALGTDGKAYVIEDLTLNAGPATWGQVVADAFDRHDADLVVAEANYGGEMVRHTIQTARPKTPYKAVTATRGKVVRAEPVSALYEQGKIRHVGRFDALEEELLGFTQNGYNGERSPNRADALVWAITELFPSIVNKKVAKSVTKEQQPRNSLTGHALGWMT